MTAQGQRKPSCLIRLTILGVVAAGVALLPSAGGVAAGSSTPAVPATIDMPLATSLATSAGTWASVPMGHLNQPLDTFWQLFLLPTQGQRWANHAAQLGIATNGGFLLAAPGDGSLEVAIRPSNKLRFSPLVTTLNGESWTPALPVPGTATSLAAGADQELVLVHDASGGRVLSDESGASGWHVVVDAHSLGSTPAGHSCAPLELTAVAVDPTGAALVGASCGRAGVAGVFADRDGNWQSIGPELPPSEERAKVEVLSLRAVGGQLSALLALTTRSGTRLVDGSAGASDEWQLSGALSLGSRGRLLSVGPVPGGGEFVLYRLGSREQLAVTSGPAGSWASLPDPPSGTATVAFSGDGRVDALAADDTVMTDWVLGIGGSSWAKHQVMDVEILFGSSS